jgi:hypothetical protein
MGSTPSENSAFNNPRVLGAELYPPALDGRLGGAQSGLLVVTKLH